MRIGGAPRLGSAEVGFKIPFQNEILKIVRSFNAGAAFTAASILPALGEARIFASHFREKADSDRSPKLDTIREALGATPGTLRQQIRRDLTKAVAQLDYLVKHLEGKGKAPHLFKAGHKTFQDVKDAILKPYFLASTWGELIQAANANFSSLLTDLKVGIKNVPSTIVGGAINYVADQARLALPKFSIPWWAPVLGVVAIGGLVAGPVLTSIMAKRKVTS